MRAAGRRRLAGLLAALPLLAFAAAPKTRPTPRASPQAVVFGTPLEARLAAGDAHAYDLHLSSGDLLEALVEQRGSDVSLELLDAQQRAVLELDQNADPWRTERLLWVAAEGGVHRVVVAAKGLRPGGYRLTLAAPRPAGESDVARVAVEREAERAGRRAEAEPDAERQAAIVELTRVAAAFADAGDARGEAEARQRLAKVQVDFDGAEAVAPAATRSLELFERLGDRAAWAWSRTLQAEAARLQGDEAGARRGLAEAAHEATRLGDEWALAAFVNRQGDLERGRGNFEAAIEFFERAIEVGARSGAAHIQMYALNNLGVCYRSLGEYERALAYFERAWPLARGLGPGDGARVALNLGNVHRSLDRNQQALELYGLYLKFARDSGSLDDEARALSNMAVAHQKLGDFRAALEESQRSLELRRQLGRRSGEAQSLRGVADSLEGLGRSEEAVAAFEQALRIHRELYETRSEAEALYSLAGSERSLGRLEQALAHVEESVRLTEALRARLTSPSLRASFVAAGQEKYELLVELHMRLGERDPAGAHAQAAFDASERARARGLLDALAEARVDVRAGVDATLLQQQRESQERLDAALGRLARLGSARASEATLQAASAEAGELAERHAQILAQLRKSSPAYAELMQPVPMQAGPIRRELLDVSTVLLEYALGEERSFLFALDAQGLEAHALPARVELERDARELYGLVTARQAQAGGARVRDADRRLPAQADALGERLLGPIAARLRGDWRGKRLAIVAAGALAYLPFGALPVPGTGGRLLLEEHELVSLPSASVLAALRRERPARAPAGRSLVVLADPVFEREDPRLRRVLGPRPAPSASAGPALLRAARGLGRSGFARLPFSRAEARAIAALAPQGSVREALDFRASRAWIDQGGLAGRGIVHFATHGLLNGAHPALSGLLLSLVDERGAWQDGFLRLTDIYNLKLDAELVVLSACQTALGKDVRGEGLIGVTRGFMYAGAPRVAASLWQVDDESTAELMRGFYRGLLREGRRPAEALRLAQLELRSHPRWAAPYYWAGFVLQGEWR